MVEAARILVIDQDRDTRDFISMALADEGYEARSAGKCPVAFDLIRSFSPTLILLDVHISMVNEKDLVDHCRQALSGHAHIVALTTAFDPDKVARQINADGYLSKPFALDDLFDIVGRYSV